MAFTSTKIITARGSAVNGPSAVNTLIAAEILAGNSPVGMPQITPYQAYPEIFTFEQSVAVGVATVTEYKLLAALTAAALVTATNTEVTGGALLLGGVQVLPSQQNTSRATFFQATYKGVAADCGLGAAGAQGVKGDTGATGPQTTFYGASTTAANTYAATIASATPLVAGERVVIKFTHTNTGAATLNINGTSAVAIVTKAGAALSASAWADGDYVGLTYDGTSLVMI